VLPDEDAILAAGAVKAAHPVSYSDAFAISLAQSEKASVITGDDEIRKAESCRWNGSALKGGNVRPIAPENAKSRDYFAELCVPDNRMLLLPLRVSREAPF
jgi:hypothetical protein